MNSNFAFKAAVTATLAALALGSAHADVVETKNGARITGTVVSIDATSVVVDTDFAGEIKIKKSEVASVNTEKPIVVRLDAGTTLAGTISSSSNDGSIQVAGSDGTISTNVGKVAATWAPGGTDPAVAALERKWEYEATADITGKTGNSEQLGTAFGFRATLQTPQDTLQFYAAYDRQVTDGEKSSDMAKAGVDYANNFSGKYSWYVRDEGGFDRVKDIELYNIAAGGLGYDYIKEANHILTFRAGLAFRYEGYETPGVEDVKDAGLDLGLNHKLTRENYSIVNRLSWVPSFEDFANYRLNHESFVELPLKAAQWKLRLGISNDYNSKPTPGVDKLDTTYFTRFVLTLK